MSILKLSLPDLNLMDRKSFVDSLRGVFEHTDWIADRAWSRRPFKSRNDLYLKLIDILGAATLDEKLALIRAHPDLVGKLAREGRLTRESTAEQAAAGLVNLTAEEAAQFEQYNAAYRERFGFPFIICARENRKEAILAAFPDRLHNSPDLEIQTALAEIAKIARLRLFDRISE